MQSAQTTEVEFVNGKNLFPNTQLLGEHILNGANFLPQCVDLQTENTLLKNYVKDLISLVTQFEFTGQKVLETLTENFILQNKAITSEFQVKCLVEALDIQLQEM